MVAAHLFEALGFKPNRPDDTYMPDLRLSGLRRSAPLRWDGLFPSSLLVEFDR